LKAFVDFSDTTYQRFENALAGASALWTDPFLKKRELLLQITTRELRVETTLCFPEEEFHQTQSELEEGIG